MEKLWRSYGEAMEKKSSTDPRSVEDFSRTGALSRASFRARLERTSRGSHERFIVISRHKVSRRG